MMLCASKRSKIEPFGGGDAVSAPFVGAHDARRRSRDQEAPVRIRLREHRTEVAIAERERLRERVVEGNVGLVPVAHRDRAARAVTKPSFLPPFHECVRRHPVLAGVRVSWHVDGMWNALTKLPLPSGFASTGWPLRVELEAVAAAEHPEVDVEGVVLLHHDDDVLDLRQRVGAFGQRRVRARSRLAHAAAGVGAVVVGGRRRSARRGALDLLDDEQPVSPRPRAGAEHAHALAGLSAG